MPPRKEVMPGRWPHRRRGLPPGWPATRGQRRRGGAAPDLRRRPRGRQPRARAPPLGLVLGGGRGGTGDGLVAARDHLLAAGPLDRARARGIAALGSARPGWTIALGCSGLRSARSRAASARRRRGNDFALRQREAEVHPRGRLRAALVHEGSTRRPRPQTCRAGSRPGRGARGPSRPPSGRSERARCTTQHQARRRRRRPIELGAARSARAPELLVEPLDLGAGRGLAKRQLPAL